MRPMRLEMEGFGTFTKRTTIDFTDTDFFVLVGPTGSGKSTVLDAMCFALYGRVPRWGNGIEYALAPSSTTGKVQLVFRAGGRLYVATRIVKRSGKGKVTTAAAGLELLREDTAAADLDNVTSLLGTSLTASAKGVTEHAERIIGLPFEQFTKCVLLPQGAFAEFLHSSGADRRKILENLLGYSVYRDIQTAAGKRSTEADTAVKLYDQQLASIPAVTDDDLTAASERIATLAVLDTTVRATVPRLDSVAADIANVDRAVADVDAEHALLTYIRTPDDLDSLTADLDAATVAAAEASDEITSAEEAEQRLRAEHAAIDLTAIDEHLRAHERSDELAESIEKGLPLTEDAEAAAAEAENALNAAARAVDDAEAALRTAETRQLAATVRSGLSEGDECPVCAQTVGALPHDPDDELDARRTALATAKKTQVAADKTARQAQITAANYRARLDERLNEKEEIDKLLAAAPPVAQLEEQRRRADNITASLRDAAARIRTARECLRSAERRRDDARNRLTTEWQKYDHHRDKVARLSPPPTDRNDLAGSWRSLGDWATKELMARRATRSELTQRVTELTQQRRSVGAELTAALAEAGLPPVHSGSGADYVAAVAAGIVAANDNHRRLRDHRAQFSQVSEQRAEAVDRARVAKQLHQHLGTRQFVNWLLTEALDDLVDGASVILRQITSGQYDLTYQDNDFLVIDHHDADLTRPVRTLSGGETFAASLALALAMSKQLSGMSSQGASLEAILLDEGFGTLDAATLDQVAATLESLASSGDRLVGVITHVPALAERIPVRFEVAKDAHGSRVTKSEE